MKILWILITSNITFTLLVALYKYDLEELDNAEALRKTTLSVLADLPPAWQSYFVKIGGKDVNNTKTNKGLRNEKVLVSHINTKECNEPPIFFRQLWVTTQKEPTSKPI